MHFPEMVKYLCMSKARTNNARDCADDKLHFMDPDSFQQEILALQNFGVQGRYLQEGMMVEVSYFNGEAITGICASCKYSP